MSLFWKIFLGFCIIWLIWYFSGGPARTDNIKPYVRYDYDTNTINNSEIDLNTGAIEMISN